MTDREEIIRMAREAGVGPVYGYESIQRFFQAAYNAGAADEREACAQVGMLKAVNGIEVSAAIRARGSA